MTAVLIALLQGHRGAVPIDWTPVAAAVFGMALTFAALVAGS
jgi:hypothetical protein